MNIKNSVYTFRIYPNKYQKSIINNTFEICKEIYNLVLKERAYVYNKFIIYSQRCLINKISIDDERFFKHNSPKNVEKIKKLNSKYRRLDESTIYSEQLSAISAYERYFAGNGSFPSYKDINSKKVYKTSNLNGSIRIKDSSIVLPKLGYVKLGGNANLPENADIIKAVIKSDKHGNYYVSLILKFKTFSYSLK